MVSEHSMFSGATLHKIQVAGQEGVVMEKRKTEVGETSKKKTVIRGDTSQRKESLQESKLEKTQARLEKEAEIKGVCREKQQTVSQEHDEEENHMFTARQEDKDSLWLIDSGCTNHMTPNEKLFIKINSNIKAPIRIGNGAVLMSEGKGDIEVMTKKGKRIIRDVLLVPNISKNLLSIP